MRFVDSSVLVAAIVEAEQHHKKCQHLLDLEESAIYSHGLIEAFSTLTGGSRKFRISSAFASELISNDYAPCLKIVSLSSATILAAMNECETRGIRGGAVYDYLHLVCARSVGATEFFTLDVSNFKAFWRDGDPQILHP